MVGDRNTDINLIRLLGDRRGLQMKVCRECERIPFVSSGGRNYYVRELFSMEF
jgi:hypothetical protein